MGFCKASTKHEKITAIVHLEVHGLRADVSFYALTSTAANAKGKGAANAKSKGKAVVKASPAATAATSTKVAVDAFCPKAGNAGVSVVSGHDAKLNQTNIANNNNKFYVLQVRPGLGQTAKDVAANKRAAGPACQGARTTAPTFYEQQHQHHHETNKGVCGRGDFLLTSGRANQMCRDAGRNNYFVWCRWGRVGEKGATAELGPFGDEPSAAAVFAKKFRDKTGNKWEVS